MVGGGSINSTNVFAALDSLKKKKKSSKNSKGSSKQSASIKESEVQQVFWPPASTLEGKSWADVDDDEDYYATPPPPVWGSSEQKQQDKEIAGSVVEEESESEDDFAEGEGEDDDGEEPEPEQEARQAEPVVKKPLPASVAPKDTERQLSKKELKKKGLAELEAVLAELGISGKDNRSSGQNEANDVTEENKSEQGGDSKRGEDCPVPTENKTSKKKKKKDKSSKEVKDSVGLDERGVNSMDPPEEDKPAVDVIERLKKVASTKKKKSNKELDAAARAAAIEAAARSAKLAAAKKKEKNHYNQQSLR